MVGTWIMNIDQAPAQRGLQVVNDDVHNDDDYCSLRCLNGGKNCANGPTDMTLISNLVSSHHLNTEHIEWSEWEHDFRHYHCVCEDGWFGVQCEVPGEQCRNHSHEGQPHVCFHGSKCMDDGNKDPVCDCSYAASAVTSEEHTAADGHKDPAQRFAGDHCEHAATDICTIGAGDTEGQILYFCVNGGICKDYVPDYALAHPGCDCQDGWDGASCEIQRTHKERPSYGNISFLLFFVAIMVATVLTNFTYSCCSKQYRRRRDRGDRRRQQHKPYETLGSNQSQNLPKTTQSTSQIDLDGSMVIAIPRVKLFSYSRRWSPHSPGMHNDADTTSDAGYHPQVDGIDPDAIDDDNDEPTVYLGPPCDGMGNALMDVEIS